MSKYADITAIILAGGKSSRMGTNKALIHIKNKPIIKYVYDALLPLTNNIIISSNSNDYTFLNAKIIPDKFSNIGPISGIYSCLSESNTRLNIITSCDVPLLNTDFYEYLISNAGSFDVSIPIHDGITEPIIGVYTLNTRSVIKNSIDKNNYSPPKIIKHTINQQVIIDNRLSFYLPEMFRSANTEEDLKIIQKII